MTIQELGSLGELVAAVATVATLVYLGVQIRANTAATKADSIRAQMTTRIDATHVLATNVQASDVFRRGLMDPRSLEPAERTQFIFQFGSVALCAETFFLEHAQGISDRETLEVNCLTLRQLLPTPGGRDYWERYSVQHTSAFREYIEAEI